MNASFSMKRPVLLLLTIHLLAAGCGCNTRNGSGFILKEGDLLFQDTDCGPLCDAIEKVTTGFDGTDLTHVGIAAKDGNGGFVVLEAVHDDVTATGLEVFLGRSLDTKGRPKVAVGRLKPELRRLIPAALKEALALKGKPYDKTFVIDNDSYYCSELIYEIFLRANNNNPVFTLQPMTFNDPDMGTVFSIWQEYFAGLGVPVPQGRPGINPGGISRSPALAIIYTYSSPKGWKTGGP